MLDGVVVAVRGDASLEVKGMIVLDFDLVYGVRGDHVGSGKNVVDRDNENGALEAETA